MRTSNRSTTVRYARGCTLTATWSKNPATMLTHKHVRSHHMRTIDTRACDVYLRLTASKSSPHVRSACTLSDTISHAHARSHYSARAITTHTCVDANANTQLRKLLARIARTTHGTRLSAGYAQCVTRVYVCVLTETNLSLHHAFMSSPAVAAACA
jgi:hypothetical protein